ncbi:MAG: hypothetical protein HC911_13995 [Chloroflexaceae bacterium]|nr:hypothetical protein [Chloroflexaceae bacterium]
MNSLRYTLLTDGSSDQALLPILTWLLRELGVTFPIQPAWADLRCVPKPPRKLDQRIALAVELYPCELLFVHRDAEREDWATRRDEIVKALDHASITLPAVGVIPVRMQEAWLLTDATAIRKAAGNPNGKRPLSLPAPKTLEALADPKDHLYALLREASELRGRRLQSLNVSFLARRVADFTTDFAALRTLTAFQQLEHELHEQLRHMPL